jgi:hypothetical protein
LLRLPRLRSDSGFRYGLCYGPSNNFRFARCYWVGSSFCPTAKLHRYHCSLVQLFKNTKVRLILQVASGDGCFRRACFFNDLCESTKVIGELQGWGLLKRWFVVEKWIWVGFCLRGAGTAGPSTSLRFGRDDKERGAARAEWMTRGRVDDKGGVDDKGESR